MQVWSVIEYFDIFQVFTHNILINYQGENRNWRKPADTNLAKLQTQHHQYWDKLMFWLPGMIHWKQHNFTTMVFLPKMLSLKSNHEEIKKRSKWGGRTFYKITSLYSSKILLGEKKKRLKYCSTLKETKETWQLAAVWSGIFFCCERHYWDKMRSVD